MIYQISGCSEAFKEWLHKLLFSRNVYHQLSRLPCGWCFDFDVDKAWMAKSSLFEYLAESGLEDKDKQFVLQLYS